MTTCACGNCQFFDTQTKAASALRKNASGLCRYNPPMPQSDGQSMWPVVANKDWCGHFAATVERFMTPPNSVGCVGIDGRSGRI